MISVNQFIRGVKSVYDEKPLHEDGCDGSNGKCDKAGLIRGGLIRGGAVNVKGCKTLNQICGILTDIRPIEPKELRVGEVVLRGESRNCTDIGVVIKVFPLEIVHMTHVTVVKDSTADAWDYVGQLPYVEDEQGETVCICSGKGSVRILSEPKFSSVLMTVPDDSEVVLFDIDGVFARISYRGTTGYVMAKFIKRAQRKISDLDLEELERAYVALGKFLGHIKETENETNERSRVHRWSKRH